MHQMSSEGPSAGASPTGASGESKHQLYPERLSFETYARLTAGLWTNIQPGQKVAVRCDKIHAPLAEAIREAALKRGAADVQLLLVDPEADRDEIASRSIDDLRTAPEDLSRISADLAESRGAYIRIVGDSNPRGFEDLDPKKVEAFESGRAKAFLALSDVIMKGLTNRCVIAAPTPGWAKMVFPELEPQVAFAKLDHAIRQICYLDAEDPEGAFTAQADRLEEQRDWLQGLNLKALRFTGPGTDLTVGLSERALWLGGRKRTPSGIVFYANVPIGEIFTTPDWRYVEGIVRMALPTIIGSKLVDGVELAYQGGELTGQRARVGAEMLKGLLSRDIFAGRLGEVALVSMDSPLAQLGIVFNEILMDEKARCHIATGRPYLSNIIGGATLSEGEKEQLGVNNTKCLVHHDFMISDENTMAVGITREGTEVPILERGLLVR
ncbi:MAG: aminopeptidase [Oligoflexia bacterium]|nr:aminopeptidase [Oligoflexia bacterium]